MYILASIKFLEIWKWQLIIYTIIAANIYWTLPMNGIHLLYMHHLILKAKKNMRTLLSGSSSVHKEGFLLWNNLSPMPYFSPWTWSKSLEKYLEEIFPVPSFPYRRSYLLPWSVCSPLRAVDFTQSRSDFPVLSRSSKRSTPLAKRHRAMLFNLSHNTGDILVSVC